MLVRPPESVLARLKPNSLDDCDWGWDKGGPGLARRPKPLLGRPLLAEIDDSRLKGREDFFFRFYCGETKEGEGEKQYFDFNLEGEIICTIDALKHY